MDQTTILYRILDANLDRAREGLRVIEDWCRFGLNQTELTEGCKAMRQELATWHRPEFRAARDTPADVGTQITHPQEAVRENLSAVLQSNLCRIEESLRVLEEYGKVYSPAMGTAMKQMRYKIYILDGKLMIIPHSLRQQRLQQLQQSHLYLVTSPSETFFETIEAALDSGLTLVQYRDKNRDDLQRYEIAKKLKSLCDRYNALFLINDRIDLVLAVDADGVHLGQQDLPFAVARQLLGPDRLIGRSTTNPDEFHRAIQEGADYIGVGPVHETPTKAGKAAAGYDYVRYAAAHAPVPWFAIGGIDLDNLKDSIAAGATRVAVVRAIMQSDHPKLTTQYLLSQLPIVPFPAELEGSV
ncbi:MAG: thiamine phosphate synthase [Synechococcales bacterium]|nr:thiamine phosphate synthase [Synechococcales bacterium]